MKYFIKTFGCAANEADSERIAAYYQARGYIPAKTIKEADDVVINTCMIRQAAEDRVYGLVHNLASSKKQGRHVKIVITGCMVGMAIREKTGKMLALLHQKMPAVDEFLPIEEVGFDQAPIRTDSTHAWVPISNGCNNFCTFCVVPFTRGREISRPLEEIIYECQYLAKQGYQKITLVGQNVNSYGADIVKLKIKNEKLKIIAVEQDPRSRPFSEVQYELPLALVVGNETYGVSKEVLDLADLIVELPMWGVNKSLNVMVSCGIVLYEIMKQL